MIRARPHRGDQNGFTLLEMVVAIGIFATMAAVAYGSLNNFLSHRDRIDAKMHAISEIQLAFGMMSRDIRFAVPRSVRDENGEPEGAFIISQNSPIVAGERLRMTTSVPSVPRPDGEDDEEKEQTASNGSDQDSSQTETSSEDSPPEDSRTSQELVRVAWRVEDGDLFRVTWSVLDRDADSAERRVRVLSGVEQFDVSGLFLDAETGSVKDTTDYPDASELFSASASSDEPNTGGSPLDGAPDGVEISLVLADGRTYTRTLEVAAPSVGWERLTTGVFLSAETEDDPNNPGNPGNGQGTLPLPGSVQELETFNDQLQQQQGQESLPQPDVSGEVPQQGGGELGIDPNTGQPTGVLPNDPLSDPNYDPNQDDPTDPNSPVYDPTLDPNYDPTTDPNSPNYDPTLDPNFDSSSDQNYDPNADPGPEQYVPDSDPNSPNYDPSLDPNVIINDPNDPNYDPSTDPTNPLYDPMSDPSSPDYDPTLDPLSPSFQDPNYDPTADPNSPDYDPMLDPNNPIDLNDPNLFDPDNPDFIDPNNPDLYDPLLDPNSPDYDPLMDPTNPEYDPTLDPSNPLFEGVPDEELFDQASPAPGAGESG